MPTLLLSDVHPSYLGERTFRFVYLRIHSDHAIFPFTRHCQIKSHALILSDTKREDNYELMGALVDAINAKASRTSQSHHSAGGSAADMPSTSSTAGVGATAARRLHGAKPTRASVSTAARVNSPPAWVGPLDESPSPLDDEGEGLHGGHQRGCPSGREVEHEVEHEGGPIYIDRAHDDHADPSTTTTTASPSRAGRPSSRPKSRPRGSSAGGGDAASGAASPSGSTSQRAFAGQERDHSDSTIELDRLRVEHAQLREAYNLLVSDRDTEALDTRRLHWLKAQNMQLERQVLLYAAAVDGRADALQAVENLVGLISAEATAAARHVKQSGHASSSGDSGGSGGGSGRGKGKGGGSGGGHADMASNLATLTRIADLAADAEAKVEAARRGSAEVASRRVSSFSSSAFTSMYVLSFSFVLYYSLYIFLKLL